MEDHVARPEDFDKLGDHHFGSKNPGRCHVCLAWVAYPYSDGSLTICPDCHGDSEAQRNETRRRVREALEPVWGATS